MWVKGQGDVIFSDKMTKRWSKSEAQERAREGAQGCYPDTVVKPTRTKDPPQNLATNNKVLSETFTTFINKSRWLMLALFLGISNKVWHIYTLGQCSQSPIKHVWQDGWPPRAHTCTHKLTCRKKKKKGNEADKTQLMFFSHPSHNKQRTLQLAVRFNTQFFWLACMNGSNCSFSR